MRIRTERGSPEGHCSVKNAWPRTNGTFAEIVDYKSPRYSVSHDFESSRNERITIETHTGRTKLSSGINNRGRGAGGGGGQSLSRPWTFEVHQLRHGNPQRAPVSLVSRLRATVISFRCIHKTGRRRETRNPPKE